MNETFAKIEPRILQAFRDHGTIGCLIQVRTPVVSLILENGSSAVRAMTKIPVAQGRITARTVTVKLCEVSYEYRRMGLFSRILQLLENQASASTIMNWDTRSLADQKLALVIKNVENLNILGYLQRRYWERKWQPKDEGFRSSALYWHPSFRRG